MSHAFRSLMMALLLAAGSVAARAEHAAPTKTVTAKPAKPTRIEDAVVAAQGSLEAGIEAYEAGRFERAVTSITAALKGRLPSHQVARAFFYRGLASRRLGKPGQAVSDLTSALEHKSGLPETERSEALENRIAARQEAGLSDSEEVVVATASKDSAVSVVRIDRPAAAANEGVLKTGSINPAEELRQASIWTGATQVALASVGPKVEPAPAATPVIDTPWAVSTEQPQATSGEVHLRVAETRSRNEAIALAIRLTSQRGGAFGSKVKINEVIDAERPPTYYVWLGPYANGSEPQALCSSLRESGYDCVIR